MKDSISTLKQRITALTRITELQFEEISRLAKDNIRLKEQRGEIKADKQYERLEQTIKSQRFIIDRLTKKNENLRNELIKFNTN